MGTRSRSKVTGAEFGLSVTSATAVTLTVPAAAMVATIYVRTAPVVFTRDGTDPTATAGVQADVGDIILLTSRDELDKVKIIAVSTSATLDVEYFQDVGGLPELIKSRMRVEGIAAEDAAAVGNPVLLGGRFDASDRTLEDGDVGAVAVDAAGKLIMSATQQPAKGRPLSVNLAVTGTMTTAIQATALKYLAEKVVVTGDQRNTDAAILVGDVVAQSLAVNKGVPLDLGAIDPTTVYLKAYTTAGDDAGVHIALADRPGYRQIVLEAIEANGGAHWPLEERSGTALADKGSAAKSPYDLLLTGATLGNAGIFGLGIDFDATGDYLRQKSEAANSGAVTASGTAAFTLDDAGAVFTATIRDGAHWVVIKDNTGRFACGYIGTSDVDSDNTKVQIFTTTGRTVSGYSFSTAAFSEADTPLTFFVFKELHSILSFTFGLWLDDDSLSAYHRLICIDDGGSGSQFFLNTPTTGLLDFTVYNAAATAFSAAATVPIRTGQLYFLSGTYEASTRITLYVNGREVAENTTSIPSSLHEPGAPLMIGGHKPLGTPAGLTNGRISHPFFIKAAMKDNWHRSLFEAGRR